MYDIVAIIKKNGYGGHRPVFNAYGGPLRAGDRQERTGFIRKKKGGVKHGRPRLRQFVFVSDFEFLFFEFPTVRGLSFF